MEEVEQSYGKKMQAIGLVKQKDSWNKEKRKAYKQSRKLLEKNLELSSRETEQTRARMHHKVVGNFGNETDVRRLYHSR